MMIKLRNATLFLIALLVGCAPLGLAPADNFDAKLAYAYATNTAIRDASTASLNARQITSSDMNHIMAINDQVKSVLDTAKLAQTVGNSTDANAKLLMATTILTSLQTFLNSKGVKTSLNERSLSWA